MQRVAREFIGASTSSALVTQEGAMDSPEIQQGSPRHKRHLNGQEKKSRSTVASGKTDQACVVLVLLGLLCYLLTRNDLERKLEGKTSSLGNTDEK